MSLVTNAIIVASGSYNETLLLFINEYFTKGGGYGRGFSDIDSDDLPDGWYGGDKCLEANIFIGAFNYLRIDELVAHLRSADWCGNYCQLIYKGQEDSRFRIIDIS